MSKNITFEDNKLFAQFLMHKKILDYNGEDCYLESKNSFIDFYVSHMDCNYSYNFIMSVFEKISNIDHLFLSMQLGGYTTISINEQDDDLKHIVLEKVSYHNENQLEFMYKYAIEFIKMYNNIYLKNNDGFWSLEDLENIKNETN